MTLSLAIDLWCKVWGSLAIIAIIVPVVIVGTASIANMVREMLWERKG